MIHNTLLVILNIFSASFTRKLQESATILVKVFRFDIVLRKTIFIMIKNQVKNSQFGSCADGVKMLFDSLVTEIAERVATEVKASIVPKEPSSDNTSEYYTISEVCEKLRISKATFHNHVNAGLIKTVKIGRRTLIESKAFDDVMASRNGNCNELKN